jgi:hypothetical protein
VYGYAGDCAREPDHPHGFEALSDHEGRSVEGLSGVLEHAMCGVMADWRDL